MAKKNKNKNKKANNGAPAPQDAQSTDNKQTGSPKAKATSPKAASPKAASPKTASAKAASPKAKAASPKAKTASPKATSPQQVVESAGTIEGKELDIGNLLAPLNRQQLELVIVQALIRNPTVLELIHRELKADVDTAAILNEVQELLEEGTVPERQFFLQEYITRARDYANAEEPIKALDILEAASYPIMKSIIEDNPPTNDQEKTQVEEMVSAIESAYNTAFEQANLKLPDFEAWFERLAGWRTNLNPILGPVFSDPLRCLKKRIRTLTEKSTATSSRKKIKPSN